MRQLLRRIGQRMRTIKKVHIVIGAIVGLITIIASVYGLGEWLYRQASRSPKIVVRGQASNLIPDGYIVHLTFSVANRSQSFLYINKMRFIEKRGEDQEVGASLWLFVAESIEQIYQWARERIPFEPSKQGKKLVAKLPRERGVVTLTGANVEYPIFTGERIRLDPGEQKDYELELRVGTVGVAPVRSVRVAEVKGWIVVEYEGTGATAREVRRGVELSLIGQWPGRRDRDLPKVPAEQRK